MESDCEDEYILSDSNGMESDSEDNNTPLAVLFKKKQPSSQIFIPGTIYEGFDEEGYQSSGSEFYLITVM